MEDGVWTKMCHRCQLTRHVEHGGLHNWRSRLVAALLVISLCSHLWEWIPAEVRLHNTTRARGKLQRK